MTIAFMGGEYRRARTASPQTGGAPQFHGNEQHRCPGGNAQAEDQRILTPYVIPRSTHGNSTCAKTDFAGKPEKTGVESVQWPRRLSRKDKNRLTGRFGAAGVNRERALVRLNCGGPE
jgi:hypothetical protein